MATVAGCASAGKQSAAEMEDRNQKLAAQLNKARSDLDAERRALADLNQRLAAANRDIDGLRSQVNAAPVESAPAGWTAVPGGGMIAIEENILFQPGKITLRDEAKKTLDAIVSTLEGTYSGKDIIVFGHTDDRPIKKSGWDDNWQLSTERSLAVVRYLGEHGVKPDRLVAAGCGEHRARVANNSEPNRLSNRRVEIFAIEAQARTGRGK
jgi:chemotaxis protein MotB